MILSNTSWCPAASSGPNIMTWLPEYWHSPGPEPETRSAVANTLLHSGSVICKKCRWSWNETWRGNRKITMKGISSKRKLQLLLSCVVVSSLLCLLVIIRKRTRHEKLTDYHFFKDDNRFFWDKKFVDAAEKEMNNDEIREGKYIPPRRVVHIGNIFQTQSWL